MRSTSALLSSDTSASTMHANAAVVSTTTGRAVPTLPLTTRAATAAADGPSASPALRVSAARSPHSQ